ncbi:MAG: hypothetical protein LM590_13375 [Thermofilum sp.]|jgi:hypothetical protein|nr:hypothetical protein [Thermofilum sp.]
MVSYTMLFITSVYALAAAVIAIDILERRALKEEFERAAQSKSFLLYLRVFKVLMEAAILWLIVAFFGQILMGWISL